jgi:hypothetical protein
VIESQETWIALGRGTVIWIPSMNFLAAFKDRPSRDCSLAYGYPVFERVGLWRWCRIMRWLALPILFDLLTGTTLTNAFLRPRHPGPAERADCHFRPASPIEATYESGDTEEHEPGA